MCSIASSRSDSVVQGAPKALESFEYSEVVGKRYSWKYLSDDSFTQRYLQRPVDIYAANHAFISHLARIIEAFEVVSIWRTRDLVDVHQKFER
jgi:hypothetical protein